MYLFLAFLLVPVIEIGLFIQVGGAIGMWPTLAIVVLTAVLGTWLVRSQGKLALSQLQASFSGLSDPTEPLAHGAMILIAGALLLTPGFFTDAVGFALLMPPVRVAVYRFIRSRVKMTQFQMGPEPHSRHPQQPDFRDGDVIDGDFEEMPSPRNETGKKSGWTRDRDRH